MYVYVWYIGIHIEALTPFVLRVLIVLSRIQAYRHNVHLKTEQHVGTLYCLYSTTVQVYVQYTGRKETGQRVGEKCLD